MVAHSSTALWTVVLLATPALGDADIRNVWASVVFTRNGERTPTSIGNYADVLTTIGAQQAYSAGQFLKTRYLTTNAGFIHGLDMNRINSDDIYILAADEQPYVATAQAFMQGLYPPATLGGSNTSTYDPTSETSSNTYIEAPLNGYQYPYLHVAGPRDADYIYVAGDQACPALNDAKMATWSSTDFQNIQTASAYVYAGIKTLLPANFPESAANFGNAYAIYEYISFQAAHNSTVATLLQSPSFVDPATNQSYLHSLQLLADRQEQMQLANMTAYNTVTNSQSIPDTAGSISTVAGNMLAMTVVDQLSINVETFGQERKLTLLFGGFEPLVSLFALMGLSQTSNDFTGLPEYASSAAFELFSWENSTNVSYPDPERLYVAFHFRNGTGNASTFPSYPAFRLPREETDIPWNEFHDFMWYAALGHVGEWCTQCGARQLFCAAWNSSLSQVQLTASSSSSAAGRGQLSPAVAGVVGAVVSLAVAALLLGLLMLLGGIRFHRRQRKNKSELGGFKGSAKLASDRDLTLPKNGVVVDAKADEEINPAQLAHERTGSWELKNAANGQQHATSLKRSSLDEEDLHVNPFGDPVKEHEHV